MDRDLPFSRMEDPEELASFLGWSEAVYRDLLALQRGELPPEEFDAKYLDRKAVLVLDMTGFTETTIRGGAQHSFLRILDAQRTCLPVFREHGASFVRTFADDIVGLFDEPNAALDAALEIHRRVDVFANSLPDPSHATRASIGIGYGDVYTIGPNQAMGDVMNRASKLGEDTARGGETLITEGAQEALHSRQDVIFELVTRDDVIFPYFKINRLPASPR